MPSTRLLTHYRERPLFTLVSLGVLASLLAYPFVDWYLRSVGVAPPFRYWDFGAYDSALSRWARGEPLYVPTDDGGYHGSFLYPPVSLLLYAPFAPLSSSHAAIAWNLVSVGLLWVGLQRLVSSLGGDLRWWTRGALLWALLGFHPLLLSLKLGQMSAFLTAMLCFASVAALNLPDAEASRSRQFVSGGLTALVGVVKLPYAPSGAHLLHHRTRLLGAVVTAIAAVALSLLAFGIDTHRTYIDVLRWGIQEGGEARPPHLWLPPYYRPLYDVSQSLLLRIGGSLAIALGAVRSAPRAPRETFALSAAAVPLLAPLTYTYYFVAAVPAVVILVAVELERDGWPLIPVLALFLLHVHSYGLKFAIDHVPAWIPVGPIEPLAVVQPGLWGNVVLVGFAAVRVAQNCSVPAVRRRLRAD